MPRIPACVRERVAEIDADIASASRVAATAEASKSFIAAISAARQVATLRTERAKLIATASAPKTESPLACTRRLRKAAEADCSWVAAARLLEQEQALEAQEVLTQVDTDDGLTPAELVERLVEAVRVLPKDLQSQVMEKLGSINGDGQ